MGAVLQTALVSFQGAATLVGSSRPICRTTIEGQLRRGILQVYSVCHSLLLCRLETVYAQLSTAESDNSGLTGHASWSQSLGSVAIDRAFFLLEILLRRQDEPDCLPAAVDGRVGRPSPAI